MYKVYCDNYLLYHSNLENLKIINPSVEVELNKTGSFEFAMYSDHPYYSLVKKLKSIITVFQDDYLLFRGRVLDDEIGWNNKKSIVCEGDMAFLIDSILRPFAFTGTVAEFLGYILGLHNPQVDESKHFQLGNVTVEGSVTYDTKDYLTTKETIEKQLLEQFGGYLMTRLEGDVVYLDYLAELNLLSPQTIKFGKNLLDLKRIRKGEDIATVIIPLGAKLKDENDQETGQRLTIESVNAGVDFIQDADAISQFGIIVKTVIFEDVTDPSELKTKAEAHLADSVNQWESLELTAADMATMDKAATSFHLGTQVKVETEPHGINSRFIVTKLSIKLLTPASNILVLGKTVQGFSEAVKQLSDGQGLVIKEVEKSSQTAAEAIYNVEQNLQASITVADQNIRSTVAENYYLKDETEALVSSVSTEIEQTQKSVEIQFTQFNADLQAVAAGADAEFEEIKKYIRFVDGKILLGEVGNELELQIANDRISFLQDGAEVAYFSDRKLFVTDAEILHSLQLGNFAFMPRSNGNLSFKLKS